MAGQQDPAQDQLSRAFFARPVLEVAPELLGCHLSHAGVTVRLTEVEAYDGSNDPGSHAFRGPTARTQVMFGEAGRLYVYFSYGIHWCANVVCGPAGAASAVLLRAGEVVKGLDLARTRRAQRAGASDRGLARGPACLTAALALGRDQNGVDIVSPDSPVVLRAAVPRGAAPPSTVGVAGTPRPVVRTGPRVGVSGPGGDGSSYPWRFWLEGEVTVSAYRRGAVRSPTPGVRPSKPGVRSVDP